MGDDGDCAAVADAGHVEPMHPGYVGTGLLDRPCTMAPDGLCLYHCLVAARNDDNYTGMTLSERATLAKGLRCATICLLREHGRSHQADRLRLSGYDGYPDEEDFMYIAMASKVSFEIEQPGVRPMGCVYTIASSQPSILLTIWHRPWLIGRSWPNSFAGILLPSWQSMVYRIRRRGWVYPVLMAIRTKRTLCTWLDTETAF